MIRKNIPLSNYSVNMVFLEPSRILHEDIYLIFLHEALGSAGQWRNFPQMLCDALGMKGFIYERRGHGESDPLEGKRTNRYLHEYAWDELPEVVRTLIPADKKVLLVGHSDGGSIALLYAAKFPKQVAGIVTMAAHILAEPETFAGIYPAIEAYHAGKLSGLHKYHGDKTAALFFAWADTWLSPDFSSWNITDDISGIACPALIMQGKEDQYGTPLQVALITAQIPGSEGIIIEQCQHHPHLEKTQEVTDLIAAWFLKNKEGLSR